MRFQNVANENDVKLLDDLNGCMKTRTILMGKEILFPLAKYTLFNIIGDMKQEHYPSLELCKKLTEIGFPTTFQHIGDSGWTVIWCGEIPEWMFVSPSVMEMLDELRKTDLRFCINFYSEHTIVTVFIWDDEKMFWAEDDCDEPLPKALAQMILWLHENKYISFN